MIAASTPSQRELRYAVDRVRHGAAVGGEQLQETMNEWLEDIETLAVALSERNATDLICPPTNWTTQHAGA